MFLIYLIKDIYKYKVRQAVVVSEMKPLIILFFRLYLSFFPFDLNILKDIFKEFLVSDRDLSSLNKTVPIEIYFDFPI